MRDILTLHPARPDSHLAMIWEHMSSGSTDHDVTPAHHSRTYPLPPPGRNKLLAIYHSGDRRD